MSIYKVCYIQRLQTAWDVGVGWVCNGVLALLVGVVGCGIQKACGAVMHLLKISMRLMNQKIGGLQQSQDRHVMKKNERLPNTQEPTLDSRTNPEINNCSQDGNILQMWPQLTCSYYIYLDVTSTLKTLKP
uniref:Uncharacterized protein n=1 Tax=Glossina austeni TaxID=7395 RepID=A0A1A9UCM8_GLOAU